ISPKALVRLSLHLVLTGTAAIKSGGVPIRQSAPVRGRFMSFSTIHLYFDDLEVGQEWTSGGRTVTEADIVNFACFSGDFNPIHIDHEYAKSTAFRRPIAHGFGVFSIASGLGVQTPPVRTMALLRVKEWNFRLPVFAGDTI